MRSTSFAHTARLALALALTLAPHPLLAAPDSPTLTPRPPTLEVEISPAIPDAQDLADWIHRSSTAALADLPHPPIPSGTIRVSVFGDLYDYEITITTLRPGSTSPITTTWPCECTNDELFASIRTHVVTAAEGLADSSSPSPSPSPPSASPDPSPPPPRPPLVFGRDGKIGLGLLVGGQALTIAGVFLVASGEYGSAELHAGIPTLVVGVTAIGAGVTMIIIDRYKQPPPTRPRAAAFPLVTPHTAQLGLAIRF